MSSASSPVRIIAQSTMLYQMGTVFCQQKMTKQSKVKVQKHVPNDSVSQQRSVLKFAFKQRKRPQKITTCNMKPRKKINLKATLLLSIPDLNFAAYN